MVFQQSLYVRCEIEKEDLYAKTFADWSMTTTTSTSTKIIECANVCVFIPSLYVYGKKKSDGKRQT